MNNQSSRPVLVLGLGASGRAAVRLLAKQGRVIAVCDEKADGIEWSDRKGVALPVRVLKDVGEVSTGEFEFAVVSPGIPHEHRWLQHARSIGLPVIPEFEFGLHDLPLAQVIAVTGTNGKSSLVKWISDTWALAGKRSVPAGNYGTPPCELAVMDNPPDAIALELSSFQLEQVVSFQPEVGVLLNLTPNHLDRHPTMEAYVKAKAHLFARMAGQGTAVMHAPSWQAIKDYLPPGLSPVWFGAEDGTGYGFSEGWVTLGGHRKVDLRGTWWDRMPLGVNAAAGVAAMTAVGIDPGFMEQSAREFVPLAHRMELALDLNGVRFINDSKASTMSAMMAAVGSGPSKKHLIAGGILKERDLNFVKETLAKNCIFVYCIGQAAKKLVSAWNDVVPCEDCGSLETAVHVACKRARPGEDVLLSPGCSSFDQFTSYAQRGEKFKQLVQQCAEETITRKT